MTRQRSRRTVTMPRSSALLIAVGAALSGASLALSIVASACFAPSDPRAAALLGWTWPLVIAALVGLGVAEWITRRSR